MHLRFAAAALAALAPPGCAGLSLREALWSLFAVHNESFNVWSHLLGALLTDATPTIAGTVEVGAQVIVTLLDAAGAAAFTVTLSPDQFGVWTT